MNTRSNIQRTTTKDKGWKTSLFPLFGYALEVPHNFILPSRRSSRDHTSVLAVRRKKFNKVQNSSILAAAATSKLTTTPPPSGHPSLLPSHLPTTSSPAEMPALVAPTPPKTTTTTTCSSGGQKPSSLPSLPTTPPPSGDPSLLPSHLPTTSSPPEMPALPSVTPPPPKTAATTTCSSGGQKPSSLPSLTTTPPPSGHPSLLPSHQLTTSSPAEMPAMPSVTPTSPKTTTTTTSSSGGQQEPSSLTSQLPTTSLPSHLPTTSSPAEMPEMPSVTSTQTTPKTTTTITSSDGQQPSSLPSQPPTTFLRTKKTPLWKKDYFEGSETISRNMIVLWKDKLRKLIKQSHKLKQQNFWVKQETHLKALVNHTMQLVDRLDARSTATVIHSLAKLLALVAGSNQLGIESDILKLWRALQLHTTTLVDSFNAVSVSSLFSSYANVGVDKIDKSILVLLVNTAICRMDEFEPKYLRITAQALTALHPQAPLLFEALASAAQLRIHELSPQALSNTAWLLATLNHRNPLLLEAMARAAQWRLDTFTARQLANMAWSCAKLNHVAPLLLDAMARSAQGRMDEFEPIALSNFVWALAVFDFDLINLLISRESQLLKVLQSIDPRDFDVKGLCQLHQFHLWCKERHSSDWFPEELNHCCKTAFVSPVATRSEMQKNVVKILRTLQNVESVKEEVMTGIGYSLDAVIVYRGKVLGVEVDGPFHYLNKSKSPNGSTVLKRRQLHTLEAWQLVSVPHWEWCRIKSNPKKEAFLRKLLDRAAAGG